MKLLSSFISEGLFDHIGLSECSAATVKEVNAIVPVAAVEIEVSPWSYTQEVKDGKHVVNEDGTTTKVKVSVKTHVVAACPYHHKQKVVLYDGPDAPDNLAKLSHA